MAREDISMLLYHAGFGNECHTLGNKYKAIQCILFSQVFKSRCDEISDLKDGLNAVGILELLRVNEACHAFVFPLRSEVGISENDALALLDYEEDLSDQEKQVKLWFTEYVKLLAKGNVAYYFIHDKDYDKDDT